MSENNISNIQKFLRAVNYLTATQIYLQDNYLLGRPLRPEDIKPRLLGHWGTCPGISFVYAHLNRLIKETDQEMMYVVGPGHGFPAIQSCIFLEKSLLEFYPNATHNEDGIAYISKNFSWPYGFPSHSSPETPGVILEGGELGYSLATSYGAVLDNPDLIVACLVGDGEAETGPTATAWHINKLIDPSINGTVLPILHLNGYKISGPTFFGRMSEKELQNLFEGYGYDPIFVEWKDDEEKIHRDMIKALDKSVEKIKKEKAKPKDVSKTNMPMIVLRTPKGWTGIKEFDGQKIEGNHLSHQVVAKEARDNTEQLQQLEEWFNSYKFNELFDVHSGFDKDLLSIVPEGEKRLGMSKHAHGGDKVYKPLILPDVRKHAEDATIPGTIGSSSMRRVGEYLNDVFKLNADNKNFRLMSPDETYSNKLDKVFETTSRAFVWPHEPWDKDFGQDGRVMEMLSEHSLQGLIQGYVLTGRHGIFASYEAFIQVVVSMTDQYAKFLKVARDIGWRGDISSLNYILTSSGWRQEHNGFSHQNPGFIDDMLQRQGCFVNVYFPPDGNSTLVVLEKVLNSKKEINIIVAGKTLEPRWRTIDQAKKDLETGISIWDFASDENPDIVFAAIGDYLTKESLAAIQQLKFEIPNIRIRFVSVVALSVLGIGDCNLGVANFGDYFTTDKDVIFSFHGYPQTLKQILFDYEESNERFLIKGYVENGSTTTPFDMHIRNGTSRYHLIIDAVKKLDKRGLIDGSRAENIIRNYDEKIRKHREYIIKNGVDPDEIENWVWEPKV